MKRQAGRASARKNHHAVFRAFADGLARIVHRRRAATARVRALEL